MKKLIQLALLCPVMAFGQAVTVNWTNVHQVVDGIGAGNVYYSAPMSSANQQFFFGTGSGQLGLSMLRVAVPNGASSSGGATGCTSVNSGCAGAVLGDMQYAVSQGARIYATPFSPPASYINTGNTNCNPSGSSPTNSFLQTADYGAFATWISNFLLSAKAQGVNIYAVDVQNEPNGCWDSDATPYSASQLDTFIKNNLGPTLAGNGTNTLIFTPETNVFSLFQSYGNTCATDASCAPYLAGFNSHDYDASKSGYAVAADTYPSGWPAKKYWMTEASCFLSSGAPAGPNFCLTGVNPGMAMALNWAAVIDQRIAVDGFNTYMYWWLISKNVDDEGLIDNNGTVTSLAYVMGQYAKFVRPGYYRIDATHIPQSGVTVSAYQNVSTNTWATIATNQNSSSVSQTINLTNGPNFTSVTPTVTSASQNMVTQSNIAVSSNSFTATLPAQSVTTFVGTASSGSSQLWTGILAPNRAINWTNAGATIPSGTPANCATQPSASITSVNAAIAADVGGSSYCTINVPAGTIAAGGTTLLISHAGQANILLKGAGANQTFFTWSSSPSYNCTGIGPTGFCITSGDSSSMSGTNVLANSAVINSGYAQGSQTLNLAGFANLKVGTNLVLMQQDPATDNGNAFFCGSSSATVGPLGGCSWQGSSVSPRPGSVAFSETQLVYVTGCGATTYGAACTSGTVTISSPIYAPNWTSGQNPHAWWANGLPITNVGVMDLSIDTSGATGTKEVGNINNAQNVWIEGVRSVNGTVAGSTSAYDHWLVWQSTHVTTEFNYMYGSAAQSGGYGIDWAAASSDSLAESNITQHMDTGYITETSVGSVFGYNFATDNYYGSNWQQCDRYEHDAGDYYNLWEGNDGICIAEDDIHGSHLWNTYYREFASGFDPSTANGARQSNIIAAGFSSYARYINFVNSVLGNTALAKPTTTYQNIGLQGNPTLCPGFPQQAAFSLNFGDGGNQIPFSPQCISSGFTIDNDNLVTSTLMRWNNYDVVTGAVRRCTASSPSPCTGDETASSAPTYPGMATPNTLFPCSFYLSSCATPSWWSTPGTTAPPYPATGGDVSGGSSQWGGHHYSNPANYCYHTVMGGLDDGTSGPLAYNRLSCFNASTPTAAAPVFSPVSPYSGAATTVTLSSTTPASTITYCQDTINTCTPATTGTSVSFSSTGYIRAFATASGYAQSSTSSWQGTVATPTLAAPTFSPLGIGNPDGYFLTNPTVTISVSSGTPSAGATYYMTTPGSGGSDSNPGTSASPWASPNHAVNCGDTIIMATGAYNAAYLGFGSWGAVTPTSTATSNYGGHCLAWVKCATAFACTVTASSTPGAEITASHWALEGVVATTTAGTNQCFTAYPPTSSANLQDILFVNDIANGCYGGGFTIANDGSASVDYFNVVGSIAYNAAQTSSVCTSGINLYQPTATDSLAGTHLYVAQNFTYGNVDPNPCNGGTPSDGEGIIFDTLTAYAYTQQAVVENNISMFNGSNGVEVCSSNAPITIRNNTVYGNNTDSALTTSERGEVAGSCARNTNMTVTKNITQTTAATSGGNNLYNYYMSGGDATSTVAGNFGYSAAGNNTDCAVGSCTGFSFGSNAFGTAPGFASAPGSIPSAPSCGSYATVQACMAAIIADFVPSASGTSGLGYQAAGTIPTYEPLFPQFLCQYQAQLSGLVTPGCAVANIGYTTDGSTPTGTAGTITHGTQYSSPFALSVNTAGVQLQAIATASGSSTSSVTSWTYTERNEVIDSECSVGSPPLAVTSLSCTLPTVTAGDGIHCTGDIGTANPVSMTWSDNRNTGNYTVDLGPTSNTATVATSGHWHFPGTAAAGATIVTVNYSQAVQYNGIDCQAVKPVSAGTFTFDNVASQQQNGTTANPTAPSTTPNRSSESCFGGLVNAANALVPTPGTGWYLGASLPNGPNLFGEYQIQNTAVATSAPFTQAVTQWTDQQACYYFQSSTTPAATPTFSPVSGTYATSQNITISDSTPSSTIYYTTDGSIPTTASSVYSTPVPVTALVTIVRAMATASGYTQSAVGTSVYTVTTGITSAALLKAVPTD